MTKSGTLAFRNPDQKVLFDCELSGQLSDGQWENAMPQDHWEAWCKAETVVAEDPDYVGRDFDIKKDSYGFTRKGFLDEGFDLAGRAMGYVRVARTFGYDMDVRSVTDYDKPQSWMSDDLKALVTSIDQKQKAAVIEDASIYGRDQLIADLRDISAIMKIDVRTDPEGLYTTFGRGRSEIHVGTCRVVNRKTDWNRQSLLRSDVVRSMSQPYGARLHECITGDLRAGLRAEATATADTKRREEHRRNLLIDAAVAKVAAEKMAAEVGPTTVDESTLFDTYVSQIRNGQFTPHSVRDLREVAIKQSSI